MKTNGGNIGSLDHKPLTYNKEALYKGDPSTCRMLLKEMPIYFAFFLGSQFMRNYHTYGHYPCRFLGNNLVACAYNDLNHVMLLINTLTYL